MEQNPSYFFQGLRHQDTYIYVCVYEYRFMML